jgi:hypothetical protein
MSVTRNEDSSCRLAKIQQAPMPMLAVQCGKRRRYRRVNNWCCSNRPIHPIINIKPFAPCGINLARRWPIWHEKGRPRKPNRNRIGQISKIIAISAPTMKQNNQAAGLATTCGRNKWSGLDHQNCVFP